MTYELPALIRELEELVGLKAALAIVESWGGLPLHVPKTMTPDHPIARAVGLDAAAAIAGRFGGDYMKVPRCVARVRALRDEELRDRWGKGEPARKLARDYQLTIRHVWRIVARRSKAKIKIVPPVDPRQRSLFKLS